VGRHGHPDGPGDRLDLRGRAEIPLHEVSGLAIGRWGGGSFVVAVGDRGPDVAFAPLAPHGPVEAALAGWQSLDLSGLPGPQGTPRIEQAEAIALDWEGRAVVLIEDPPLLVVVDMTGRRITHACRLDAGGVVGLAEPWATDAASRGEGLVLLEGGHVLVVKEKHPAGVIEFGPVGDAPQGVHAGTLLGPDRPWSTPTTDRLVALAWWPGDSTLADWSDAAIGPDGRLYLLSDKSAAIGRIALPLAPTPGATARIDAVWLLPRGVRKAEGLAFLPDGGCLVASDRPGLEPNLALLPAPIEWPIATRSRPA
jgi:hypothetical protein